jgi:hypothetical protein
VPVAKVSHCAPETAGRVPIIRGHKQTKTMKDNFLAAFRLLDEHNVMAFNYWETVLFDEEGEWIESEVTESNLFSMRMDACCAAGKVLCEV